MNRIKRVSIAVPNYILRDEYGDPGSPPIGPAMVAATLRDAGFEVDLIDADAENLSMDETVDRILSFSPDAVGLSCNYITKHNPTMRLAAALKSKQPGLFIFAGGNHAAAYSEGLIVENGPIDVVLTGEGEAEAPALLKAMNERGSPDKSPGAVIWTGGKSTLVAPRGHVEDLNTLPLAAYDLLPMEKYRRFELVTSRGCPYTCSFCASTEIVGTKVRLRSPESVVNEVEHLRKHYGDRFLWISDDTFTAIKTHAVSVSAALEKVQPPVKWSCFATAVTLKTEVLAAMKRSGCEYLSIGVETTHPSQKRYVGKRVTDDSIAEAVQRCHDAGLRVYGFIIVGFPGENKETLESRYRLIEKAKFDDVGVNTLIPLPGTMIWHELIQNKLFDPKKLEMDYLFARVSDDGDSDRAARLTASWTDLSVEELLEGVRICRELGQSSSPNYIPRDMGKITEQQVCA